MNRLLDYMPELEIAFPAGAAGAGPMAYASASAPALEDDAEMADGAALLEAGAGNGDGLAPFLAGLVASAGPAGRTALRMPLGRALMSVLLQAATALMPFSSRPAQQKAAAIFGLELEGLSAEDKEFALARHFIRMARELIAGALASGPAVGVGREDAESRVQAALVQTARKYAPGLLHRTERQEPAGGRWQRSGKRIVVLNC
ncbi:hypothetical protein ASD15_13000 [Massilia sp. Root351]|jgi:hypothetical protein|uniref:hypothetical protein n=1 Tax=Massilia sp. Root351 TaxID=1736522 RepID=UPI00070F3E14|nr:hypothetical protein [Massilia sp. Root351]KQV80822.1 hypothetical protein ASD15_13000 [Massilia sp. Root351]